MRDATREWASWVIPLLIVEYWIAWRPQLRKGGGTRRVKGEITNVS